MTIKDKIKKSFFDILSPPSVGKEASPNLLNVPIKIISNKCLYCNDFILNCGNLEICL